jgi:hypothetical protein
MPYIGEQVNNVKQNTGTYTPNEILQLEKDGHWGGSLELIQSQTVSGVTTVDFTDIKENIYDVHFLTGILTGNGDSRPYLRFFENGTIEDGSVYEVAYQQIVIGSSSENRSTGVTNLDFFVGASEVGQSSIAHCYIYNAGNSAKYTYQTMQGMMTSTIRGQYGGGVLPQASVVDGFRIQTSSANTINGTIKLYGMKQL